MKHRLHMIEEPDRENVRYLIDGKRLEDVRFVKATTDGKNFIATVKFHNGRAEDFILEAWPTFLPMPRPPEPIDTRGT